MPTRKIVPRADNEGGLGTALKRWASAFINTLTADSATIGTLSGMVKAASGVLSALALGAANLKLFMNAAGNAPEWAWGIRLGLFTRDTALASGDQAVTGLGFKPSHLLLMAEVISTSEISFGLDDGSTHYVVCNLHAEAANQWYRSSVFSIWLVQGSGVYYQGYVSALGADGFTISWTKSDAKTGTACIYYMAFR